MSERGDADLKEQGRREAAAREARRVLLERSVLQLAACGYSAEEICAELAKQAQRRPESAASLAEVRRVLRRAQEEAAREVSDGGAQALRENLLTLRELKRAVAPRALGGNLGAVKEVREIVTLQAKLHGWIVERQEVQAPLTPQQLDRLRAALRDPTLPEEERERARADLLSGDAGRVSAALARLGV